METTWRSRDAYKAAFWNMYALTELQSKLAERISEKTGRNIKSGQYVDFSNSYHIYEQDFQDVKMRLMRRLNEKSFKENTMTTEEFLKILYR